SVEGCNSCARREGGGGEGASGQGRRSEKGDRQGDRPQARSGPRTAQSQRLHGLMGERRRRRLLMGAVLLFGAGIAGGTASAAPLVPASDELVTLLAPQTARSSPNVNAPAV